MRSGIRAPRAPVARLTACTCVILSVAACGDGHSPREDSVAVAQMLAAQSAPVVTPGVSAELRLVDAGVGGIFDSTFRAGMAPVVQRLRGGDSLPAVVIDLKVGSVRFDGDSAEVLVHRRGFYRADTTRFSSSDTRYRFLWQQEAGWSLAQTEPFNFQGEGAPSSRARDEWWPGTRD